MRSLGLDVGSKTIGVARSDAAGSFASALGVLARAGETADVGQVIALVEREQAACVVVGLPLELDGRVGRRARTVLRFAEALRARLDPDIAVETWDERFSTAAAERTLLEADLSRARRKQLIDAAAAQVILQGFLDHRSVQARRAP